MKHVLTAIFIALVATLAVAQTAPNAQADPCLQYVLASYDGTREHWSPQNVVCRDGSPTPLKEVYNETPVEHCYQYVLASPGHWEAWSQTCTDGSQTPLKDVHDNPARSLTDGLDPCYQYVLASNDGTRKHLSPLNLTCRDGSPTPLKEVYVRLPR